MLINATLRSFIASFTIPTTMTRYYVTFLFCAQVLFLIISTTYTNANSYINEVVLLASCFVNLCLVSMTSQLIYMSKYVNIYTLTHFSFLRSRSIQRPFSYNQILDISLASLSDWNYSMVTLGSPWLYCTSYTDRYHLMIYGIIFN